MHMEQKKIKICHVVASLDTGGMENGVINISNRMNREHFEPTVLCVKNAGSMANRLAPDVNLINFNAPEGRHPFRFSKLGKLFKQEGFSLIHTHGWGGCSFDSILGAKWGRVPLIVNGEHGAFFLHPRQVFLQKCIYKLCDANLSVSDALQENVTRHLGIPKNKITTITNGVDCDLFTGAHNTDNIEAELNLPPASSNRITIGNIGSLKQTKNQALLLQAVSKLKHDKPDLDLVVLLIGEGPDRSMLETLANELGISEIIHFLGLRQDTPQLLSFIDLLVSVSTSEGMSNVTLESFSSEVPVVTTRSIGMNEIVQDGKTGYLLNESSVDELASKLLSIYQTPRQQLKQIGVTARRFVLENHSIDKMVRNYEDFYIKLWNNR